MQVQAYNPRNKDAATRVSLKEDKKNSVITMLATGNDIPEILLAAS